MNKRLEVLNTKKIVKGRYVINRNDGKSFLIRKEGYGFWTVYEYDLNNPFGSLGEPLGHCMSLSESKNKVLWVDFNNE